MTDPIIKVHNLGKRYRIGAKVDPKGMDNFRDAILNTLQAPFKNLKRLRNLTNFDDSKPSAPGSKPYALCPTQSNDILWALKDVSFEINRGDVVGIIGRNGSGKSTLLKILSRITEPTEGYVELRGRVASLLEVGTGFHRELTGRENIYLNGSILGMKKWEIDKKFDEIMAFSEIEKFMDTPVKHYSSGMYVRLAFAVAAHLDPEILLVDEVLAVGDAAFQKKCLGKMSDIAKGGRTVLFVSHNMGAVKQLCKNGILLNDGRIACYGYIDDCLAKYLGHNDTGGKIILEHITFIDKDIKISSWKVNNSMLDELYIDGNCSQIDIEVMGEVSRPMRLNIMMRILDSFDVPLAVFSPGHERGYTDMYKRGKFQLNVSIKLPKITKGEYYLYFCITDPGINTWVEISRGVRLIADGSLTTSGHVFNYSKGNGWVFLSSLHG